MWWEDTKIIHPPKYTSKQNHCLRRYQYHALCILGYRWLLNWERMDPAVKIQWSNPQNPKGHSKLRLGLDPCSLSKDSIWLVRGVWQQADVVSMVQGMEEREPSWEKPSSPVVRGWGVSKEIDNSQGRAAWPGDRAPGCLVWVSPMHSLALFTICFTYTEALLPPTS